MFINKIDLLQFILLISQNSIISIIIIHISKVALVSFINDASRFTATKGNVVVALYRRNAMGSPIPWVWIADPDHVTLHIWEKYNAHISLI